MTRHARLGPLQGTVVVLSFAESLAAPEAAWSLLDAGASVVALTRDRRRSPLRFLDGVELREVSAPELDAEAATADIAEVAQTLESPLVLPLDDASIWLCDRAFSETRTLVIAPTGTAADLALDKRRQLAVAEQAGFSIPPTRVVESIEEALEGELPGFPIVVKPALAVANREGRLVKGPSRTCADRSELEAAARSLPASEPYLLQSRIRGIGEGCFGLARTGTVRVASAHVRLRMMNPEGSGSSACISAPVDELVARQAETMIRLADWNWPFMIELLRDATGRRWFIELNGRLWGSLALARRLGYEYPAWEAAQAIDPSFDPSPPQPREQIVCRHLGREIAHFLFVMRGPRSRAFADWPGRRVTTLALLRRSPGQCWYNRRPGESRFFLADTIRTVAELVRDN